jgi:hypothetical protein
MRTFSALSAASRTVIVLGTTARGKFHELTGKSKKNTHKKQPSRKQQASLIGYRRHTALVLLLQTTSSPMGGRSIWQVAFPIARTLAPPALARHVWDRML